MRKSQPDKWIRRIPPRAHLPIVTTKPNGDCRMLSRYPGFQGRKPRTWAGFTAALMLTLLLTGVASERASAALIIEVEDTEIGAGQSGVVNVWISSSDGNDLLSFYNYFFEISSVVNRGGTLWFDDPQSSRESSDLRYVFTDDSFGLLFNPTDDPSSQVEASDFTASAKDVRVPVTADRRLLAQLDVRHLLGNFQSEADAIGERFEIALIEDDLVTYFGNLSSDSLELEASSFSPGTITIIAPSVTAVPEPSSLILFAAGGAGWLVRSRRKRAALAAASIAR